MDILVALATVGEELIFESLDKLKAAIPHPYRLSIWYDACGRGVDNSYLDKLRLYTDDIILSTCNKSGIGVWGFYLLYEPYDYIILTCPDFFVYPDFFHRIMEPFKKVDKLAMVGEAWRKMTEPWILSDFDRGIDGIVMIKKESVDDVGGFSPSFNGRGPFHQELYRRFVAHGWHYAAVDGLCRHGINGARQHEARDRASNWEVDLHKDNLTWLRLEKLGYRGYKWWSTKN